MRYKMTKAKCNCEWSVVAYIKQQESEHYRKATFRVRDLHKPDTPYLGVCLECGRSYPCPTIEVLDGEK